MIESRHLVHVLALARHRNFGRAAQEVYLTQSALTRSIQTLERRLGVRLFDRDRSGVDLTAFGRLVVERARGIATDLRDLESDIDQMKNLEIGNLYVAMAPYPSALSGQAAVGRLLASHPSIRCRIRVTRYEQVIASVAEGSSDVGFAELSTAVENPELEAEAVVTRPASFFCRPGHPLAERMGVALEDLTSYPWVTTRMPRRMGAFLPADLGRAGSWHPVSGEFVPAIETDVVHGFTSLAMESDALLGAAATIVVSDLEAGRLRRVPFAAPWLRFQAGFITRRSRTLPPIAEEFKRLVRSIEAELDEQEEELQARFAPGQ